MPFYSPANSSRSSWFLKLVESILAMIAFTNILSTLLSLFPEKFKGDYYSIFYWTFGISVLAGAMFSIYWHRKEMIQAIQSARVHVIFRGILRYWLVFEICNYGFAKLLKTQFAHSFQRDDMLAGSLSGFGLTWHYFSYSYSMAVIIGVLQIFGSVLLLFRRTVLLGVFILLPVMVNIVLINIFYKIALGAFFNSVLFSLGLLFLLLLRWQEIKKLIFRTADSLPAFRPAIFVWPLKILPVVGAFLVIWSYTLKNQPSPVTGKWKVDMMIKDGDTVSADAWQNNKRVWSNIYLEDYGQMAVCANPYVFEAKFSEYGTYKFDSLHHNMQVALFSDKDTVNFKIVHYDGDKMEWDGMFRNATTAVFLSRASITKIK